MLQSIQTNVKALYSRLKGYSPLVYVLIALCVLTVPVAAQSMETFSDDFEGGDLDALDGWSTVEGEDLTNPTISEESVNGNYSLFAETRDSSTDSTRTDIKTVSWDSGPTLDTSEQFTIEYTIQPEFELYNSENNIRTGISSGNTTEPDQNVLIIFNGIENETYLSTATNQPVEDSIPNSFDEQWTNVKIQSTGDGEVQAKVWEHGTTEPSEWQLNGNFQGTTGKYTIDVGAGNYPRIVYLDDITINGEVETDPSLSLEVTPYLAHGETDEYQVLYTDPETGERTDVSNDTELNVTSGNTSVFTVDNASQTITATDNTSINDRTTFTAEYEGLTQQQNVTVANVTVENTDILPSMRRVQASLEDDTVFFILLVSMGSIVATRFAGSFAGLGFAQLGLTIGWFIGYVSAGIAMVGLFTALFIGLNLAANIDYTVRRG